MKIATQTLPPSPDLSLCEASTTKPVRAALTVLGAISFCHMLNDLLQSLMPAIYPVLRLKFGLSFGQIGLIALVNQVTASLLQPVVGNFTDRRPTPYALPIGMGFTLVGLLILSVAWSYPIVIGAVALVGIGSAVFHPESSRIARLASGGKHGFAQSIFQVGGNAGAALGPLMAAYVVVIGGAGGQRRIAWFSIVALTGILVLAWVAKWHRQHMRARSAWAAERASPLATRRVRVAMGLLLTLMLSKFFYMASLSSYYTFYLMGHFGVSTRTAQICLALYLAAVAAGTLLGGRIGDQIGRKAVIWVSILGVLPFSLLLPHMSLVGTVVLTIPIGLLLASAFPAILVFAQDLMPGRVGTVAGLMFGLAFGFGGLGAATLGVLADRTSIDYVFGLCAYLPAIGILAAFLPNLSSNTQVAR